MPSRVLSRLTTFKRMGAAPIPGPQRTVHIYVLTSHLTLPPRTDRKVILAKPYDTKQADRHLLSRSEFLVPCSISESELQKKHLPHHLSRPLPKLLYITSGQTLDLGLRVLSICICICICVTIHRRSRK
ncbi:hypothetical protein E4U09_005996 [Claviceps aff. purpurea]|uniref:Uncharacterized protein n=1 Tax=Claviceps aff. purpurea TaxID=1967640 RepID=A0A9P7QDM7_9HYPO|nr:hypothetical protein E4U09_005996 [Claviceps aff. purpurea]